jgi:hypothetical protein
MSVVSGPSREAGTILEPPGPPAVAAADGGGARVIGVDVARGLALLGMIAVHIFDTLHGNNTPSKTQQGAGRSRLGDLRLACRGQPHLHH